jgi:hypothetical protein
MIQAMVHKEPETLQSTMLVITGDVLDPAAGTASLQLEPQQVWRKGEKKTIQTAAGGLRELQSIHEWSGWKHWLEEPFTNLDTCAQIKHWAQILKQRSAALQILKRQGAALALDCFICTSGRVAVNIPSELQSEIGALGVDLEISFYVDHEGKGSNAV